MKQKVIIVAALFSAAELSAYTLRDWNQVDKKDPVAVRAAYQRAQDENALGVVSIIKTYAGRHSISLVDDSAIRAAEAAKEAAERAARDEADRAAAEAAARARAEAEVAARGAALEKEREQLNFFRARHGDAIKRIAQLRAAMPVAGDPAAVARLQADLVAKTKAANDAAAQLKTAQDKYDADLKAAIADKDATTAERAKLQAELAKLGAERGALDKQLEQQAKLIDSLKAQLAAKKGGGDLVAQLKGQIEKLNMHLAALRSPAPDPKNNNLDQRIAAAKGFDQVIKMVQAKLDALKRSGKADTNFQAYLSRYTAAIGKARNDFMAKQPNRGKDAVSADKARQDKAIEGWKKALANKGLGAGNLAVDAVNAAATPMTAATFNALKTQVEAELKKSAPKGAKGGKDTGQDAQIKAKRLAQINTWKKSLATKKVAADKVAALKLDNADLIDINKTSNTVWGRLAAQVTALLSGNAPTPKPFKKASEMTPAQQVRSLNNWLQLVNKKTGANAALKSGVVAALQAAIANAKARPVIANDMVTIKAQVDAYLQSKGAPASLAPSVDAVAAKTLVTIEPFAKKLTNPTVPQQAADARELVKNINELLKDRSLKAGAKASLNAIKAKLTKAGFAV